MPSSVLDRLLKPYLSVKFAIFAAVAVFGIFLSVALSALFTEFLALPYTVSYVLAILLCWTILFFLHLNVTFRGHRPPSLKVSYASFVAWYAFILLLNVAFISFLTSVLHIHYALSILLSNGSISLASFGVNRKWIFRAE